MEGTDLESPLVMGRSTQCHGGAIDDTKINYERKLIWLWPS